MNAYRTPSTLIQSPLDKVNNLLKDALDSRMVDAKQDLDEVYRICMDKVESAAMQCHASIHCHSGDLPEHLAKRWNDDMRDLLVVAFNKLGFGAQHSSCYSKPSVYISWGNKK